MVTFPSLKSGAVAQFPMPVLTGQGVRVVRFMDGSDQRYLLQGRTYRSWQIQLQFLDEDELAAVEAFFTAQSGDYSTFTFPDPFSNQLVPNCRFGGPALTTTYEDVDAASTSLWVIETNG